MRKRYMPTLAGLLSAVAIHVPHSAWDLAKAGGNLELALLHDAEQSDRFIEVVRTGGLELPSRQSVAAQEAKEQ